MTNPPTILVPLGDVADLRPVEFGARLVSRAGGRVVALHVERGAVGSSAEDAATLGRLARIGGAPVDLVHVTSDAVAPAIVAAAREASLVCMATAATVLPHERHVGSIAEAVVRQLGKPVALVGPKAVGTVAPDARVVVPVDGSERAEAALGPAAQVASMLEAEIWVVTVVSHSQEQRAAAVVGTDLGVLESAYVRRLARQVGPSAQFEVLHGPDPAAAILDFAHPDGIVVMTTHGRSGLARLFAGSVTMDVVAGSGRPVVVLRPAEVVLAND